MLQVWATTSGHSSRSLVNSNDLTVLHILFTWIYLFKLLCENLHNTYLFILFSPISNFPESQICHLDPIFFSLEFVAIQNACNEHALAAASRPWSGTM